MFTVFTLTRTQCMNFPYISHFQFVFHFPDIKIYILHIHTRVIEYRILIYYKRAEVRISYVPRFAIHDIQIESIAFENIHLFRSCCTFKPFFRSSRSSKWIRSKISENMNENNSTTMSVYNLPFATATEYLSKSIDN